MDFEWNDIKAGANEKKHGISFIEATEVFGDEHSSCAHDPDHSYDERRYLLFGVSAKGNHTCSVLYRKIRDNSRYFGAAYDSSGA